MLSSGECGGTVSPFLHAHSTSRLSSSRRVGQKKNSLHSPMIPLTVLVLFILHHFAHPHIESRPLTFSSTGIWRCFSSRRELEKPLLSLRIFGCRSHSRSGMCACVFHTGFGGRCMSPCQLWPCMLSIVVCVYVFPIHARSWSSFPFADCVMLPSFHCEIGAIVFPWFWVFPELFWPC